MVLKKIAGKLGLLDFAKDWLDGCDTVYIQTHKDKSGKFGRVLADIYADEDKTACLNSDLIDCGHATAYFGGKR